MRYALAIEGILICNMRGIIYVVIMRCVSNKI